MRIPVSKPDLPPMEKLTPLLEDMWDTCNLSNSGRYYHLYKEKLSQMFTGHCTVTNSGTTALVVALKALNLTGQVITTPFTFAATTNALMWNNLEPVFVDIEEDGVNIDADKIEAAITPKTTAILATHCFGRPCGVVKIKQIADKYGLKVIYDAAHCFGVEYGGKPLADYGDASIISTHATKTFNTFEGGIIVTPHKWISFACEKLINFGFLSNGDIMGTGLNGKMNEFNAAIGYLNLWDKDVLEDHRENRRRNTVEYVANIRSGIGVEVMSYPWLPPSKNYGYMPIRVTDRYPLTRDELMVKLLKQGVGSKAYFSPLVSNMQPYKDIPSACKENLPVANKLAEEVLCLPMYSSLEREEIETICNIIKEEL